MNRALIAAVFALSLTSGCDGGGEPSDAGSDAALECSAASDGVPCGEGRICVSGACEASRCGDRVVDTVAGEQCDDGNETAFDGCEPATCVFTCTEDATCDDGAPCNGMEICDPALHTCVSGTPPTEGASCGEGLICLDESCVPEGCGNGAIETGEECDDERNGDDADGCTDRCTFTCELWSGATNVLGAVNGGFEAGSSYSVMNVDDGGPNPPDAGLWFGDRASLVMAESGIAPLAGMRMLRFDATTPDGPSDATGSQARFALVIPSPWAEMVDSGRLRAHVSARFDRVGTPLTDTQFEVSLHAYDAHPMAGGTELAAAHDTLSSDALLDTWECVRAGVRVPVGTRLLYAEIAAVEDVQNDVLTPELGGQFADEAALWFSVDPCIEGEACVPEGDRCSVGRRSCAGDTGVCEPVGPAPDGTLCDVAAACTVGQCVPNAAINRSVDLSTDPITSGRTCAEAPAYSVVSIAGSTIGLSESPDADCLAPGDEVLLINLQGSTTSTENVGRWELLRVSAVDEAAVTMEAAPVNHYGASADTDDDIGTGADQQRVALVRVPTLGNVTVGSGGVLTTAPWNGAIGGVVALRAASLDVQGRVDASALGYRTGDLSQDDDGCSNNLLTGAGESIGGNPGPSLLSSYGGPGGIGVGVQSFAGNNPVPASAGHASPGEDGLNPRGRELGPPGEAYGVGDGTRLTMGSGGAGGLTCSFMFGPPRLGSSGTQAGGIILILADTLTVGSSGQITASATGNGASGGYVLVRGRALDLGTDRVTARGAANGRAGGPTNHGSDGYIVLDASESAAGTTDPPATP